MGFRNAHTGWHLRDGTLNICSPPPVLIGVRLVRFGNVRVRSKLSRERIFARRHLRPKPGFGLKALHNGGPGSHAAYEGNAHAAL
jgi:hypothetical protein